MKTMRAAVASGLQVPLEVREVPVPEVGPGQVLVRVVASGVCHTDVSILGAEWPMRKPEFPLIPGHEAAGYVAALGAGVKGLKEGDRVGVFWLSSTCGACEFCATGREPLCMSQVGHGHVAQGTYADYCVVDAGYAIPLPASALDPGEFAPIMCAGITAYKGVRELAGLAPGSWVAISGIGGTGHLAVQYALAMGLKVAAIDVTDEKVAQAKALGASIAINAAQRFPSNPIVRETGGVHAAIVTANSAKAFEQSLRMLRRGGICVLIGVATEALSLGSYDLVTKGLTLRGSIIGNRQDLRDALQLSADGRVKAAVEYRTLDAVNDALAALKAGQVSGRIVLRMA